MELIIIIAVLTIITVLIYGALDPARRLHESNNVRRTTDVETIVDALKRHQADNNGLLLAELAAGTPGTYYQIGTDAGGCDSACNNQSTHSTCMDISNLPQNYLSSVPIDPVGGTAGKTGYYVMVTTESNIIIGACNPQGEDPGGSGTPPTIEAQR